MVYVDFSKVPSPRQRYVPKLTDKEVTSKIKHFSPSQINTIMGCKFKWAARYLYGLQGFRKTGQMLQMGIFLHDKAKYASIDGPGVFNREKMLEEMEAIVEETKGFPKEYYGNVLDVFLNTYAKLNFDNENTEVPVGGTIPGHNLECTGFVDHIQTLDDGSKRILDLKIKSTLSKDKKGRPKFQKAEIIQQGLYSYFTGIRKVALFIIKINKQKNKGAEHFVAERIFTEDDINKILHECGMAIKEMYSNNYLPNREYRWCAWDFCEYYSACHDIWDPKRIEDDEEDDE